MTSRIDVVIGAGVTVRHSRRRGGPPPPSCSASSPWRARVGGCAAELGGQQAGVRTSYGRVECIMLKHKPFSDS